MTKPSGRRAGGDDFGNSRSPCNMATETAREALGAGEELGTFERKAQAQVPDGLTRNATHQIRKFPAPAVQSDSGARNLSATLVPFVNGKQSAHCVLTAWLAPRWLHRGALKEGTPLALPGVSSRPTVTWRFVLNPCPVRSLE